MEMNPVENVIKEDTQGKEGRLFRAVAKIILKPEDAKAVAAHYLKKRKHTRGSGKADVHEDVADKIVRRYCRISALIGSASAFPGILPGIGTAIAITGGVAADAVCSLKIQVDMCMCLAEVFGYDTSQEETRTLTFFLAAAGTMEKAESARSEKDEKSRQEAESILLKTNLKGAAVQMAVSNISVKIASDTGVKLIKKYMQGASIQILSGLFHRVGAFFTAKTFEKSMPYGIGVIIGGTLNYALTKYVGHQAKQWFLIERSMRKNGALSE